MFTKNNSMKTRSLKTIVKRKKNDEPEKRSNSEKKIKEREIYNETSHKFYPCFSFRVHRVLFWDFLLASNGKRS